MRIAIDGYNLALPRGTGVATYARTLSHCLHDLGCKVDILYGRRVHLGDAPILHEIAFLDPDGVKPPRWRRRLRQFAEAFTSPFGRKAQVITIEGQVIARDVAATLPYFDRITAVPDLIHTAMRHFKRWGTFLEVRVPDPPAIMHWTYPLPIRVAGARNIYTLHDLVPLRLPFATLDDKKYYYKLIRKCVETAGHICTISQRSKADIKALFAIDDSRISNTYQSVALPAATAGQTEAESRQYVERVYGFGWKGYFLFFGAIEPKKNVARLIEAVLKARPGRPLVIIGDAAWKAAEEVTFIADYEREVQATGAPRRIHKFSYVPAPHLAALVKGARAVLFPSLYEGFGLPVLEAMLMGTPVLTSTEGAMPEIAGDATLLVDPYDVDAIAAAVTRLDADDVLVADLAQRGPGQAAKFGIPSYLARLEEMYAKVLDLDPV
ncbi:glycosyltransferase family 4 protein [Oleomonas cavernae]|uniref:glycosyltransferase family 4 protein n=1 Tax=Oleomonas cavernae TaxID=2320859 RepID=UPI001F2C8E05|nr:glycosyltransferase family 1 protein [Oleomonas cavernae]